MRRFSAILLFTVFTLHLAGTLTYMVTFALFREEIAAAFCVNQDKPELDCRGCCHLSKAMKTMNIAEKGEPDGNGHEMQFPQFEWVTFGSMDKPYPPPHVPFFWSIGVASHPLGELPEPVQPPPRV